MLSVSLPVLQSGCAASWLCCKLSVLQAVCAASWLCCLCCKLSVLQAGCAVCVASWLCCLCCKLSVLQAVCAASWLCCLCCKLAVLSVLQAVCAASCLCCKLSVHLVSKTLDMTQKCLNPSLSYQSWWSSPVVCSWTHTLGGRTKAYFCTTCIEDHVTLRKFLIHSSSLFYSLLTDVRILCHVMFIINFYLKQGDVNHILT